MKPFAFGPALLPRLYVFSSPAGDVPDPLQARDVEETRSQGGLNGDRHHPRSTRQQQT